MSSEITLIRIIALLHHSISGSSMVPVGKPWVIVRSCPPHPNPLPKERENYRQSLPHRRRFDLGTESAAPSPWGEGWGEGEGSARTPQSRVKPGEADFSSPARFNSVF